MVFMKDEKPVNLLNLQNPLNLFRVQGSPEAAPPFDYE